MNKTKRVFILKCLIILIIPFVFNFCFVSDINSYTRIMLNELSRDGYIDVLLLGASHTYRSYNVELIEDNTDLNVFCGGSSAQQLQGSYYILKQAQENNGVGTVFLDLNYMLQSYEEPRKTQTYIIADYLPDKKIKYEYLFDAYGVEGIINGILPCLHGYSFSLDVLREHFSGDYLNNTYEYVTYDNEAYLGQGFVYSYETVSDDYIFNEGTYIDPDNIFSAFSWEYLQKIITYCAKNEIELIFVNPPMPDGTLKSAENYQLYMDVVSSVAEENDLPYWDFSLVKNEVLCMKRTDYKDDNHLNGIGANKFSWCIIGMLNGTISNPFYSTFAEKIKYNPDGTID